jgi:hypothetical protein
MVEGCVILFFVFRGRGEFLCERLPMSHVDLLSLWWTVYINIQQTPQK